jgi:hypothetical protein
MLTIALATEDFTHSCTMYCLGEYQDTKNTLMARCYPEDGDDQQVWSTIDLNEIIAYDSGNNKLSFSDECVTHHGPL